MLEFDAQCIIGLDLAGKNKNPTGLALLQGRRVQTSLIYTDTEILDAITQSNPELIAIDAPLSAPKKGFSRKADREMIKKGYRVFPPNFTYMKELTLRAVKLNKLIEEKKYRAIEVHPTSCRKALQMPLKEWKAIQETLKTLGLKGTVETRQLISHELDAVTAALTAKLHLNHKTELVGDDEEGYIIVPKKAHWRTLTHE